MARIGYLVFVLFLMISQTSFAAKLEPFHVIAEGELTNVEGKQLPIQFDVIFEPGEYQHRFKLGKHDFSVPEMPKHYNIVLTKNEDGSVNVQEFSDAPMVAFKVQLKKQVLQLRHKLIKEERVLVLSVGNNDFNFNKPYAMFEIEFKNRGISRISVKGLKSI